MTVELTDTPEEEAPRKVVVKVDPGPPTIIEKSEVRFTGVNASDELGTSQRLQIEETWPLQSGEQFSQSAWSSAKSGGLKELQKRHKEIGDVDGLGLALRAEICTEDGFTPNKALLDKMVDIGLEGGLEYQGQKRGLVLDVGGYYKNVITFAPSLMISRSEIDEAMVLLDQLLTKAKKA